MPLQPGRPDSYLAVETGGRSRWYLGAWVVTLCLIAATASVPIVRWTRPVPTRPSAVAVRSDVARMIGSSELALWHPGQISAPSRASSARPVATARAIGSQAPDRSTAVPSSARPGVAVPVGFGCKPALAWLASHAAPGFRFVCPGYADGHQAMSCVNVSGVCPGEAIVVIAVPCPAAYMNEAHNSWIIAGLATGSLDPYGYCR